LLASSASFVDGYNLIIIAPVLLILAGTNFSGHFSTVLIASSALIGNFFGAIFLGNLSDRLGRKYMLVWDIVFFVVFALASALSTSALELFFTRLLLGIGIGGDYPIGSTLIAEHSPASKRGRQTAKLGFSWTLGFFTAILTGLIFLPLGHDSWRYMLAAPAIPSLIIILMRHRAMESPIWQSEAKGTAHAGKLSQIFGRGLIRATAFAASFWFIFDVVQYGITTYAPSVVSEIGFASHEASLTGSLLIAGIELIATLIGMHYVDVLGRRPLLLIGFAGIALSMFLASVSNSVFISLGILLLFALSTGFGPGIIEFVMPPELFPTNVRSSGAGFANTMSRLGAVVGVVIQPVLAQDYGIHFVFLIYGVVALCGLLITYLIAPETKGTSLTGLSAAPLEPPVAG
jgi:putative MFS transporter